MDSSNRPNRVHPIEARLNDEISEYSGYIELLKELLGKHDEAHDKAIEVAIKELTHRIFMLKRKLSSPGRIWP